MSGTAALFAPPVSARTGVPRMRETRQPCLRSDHSIRKRRESLRTWAAGGAAEVGADGAAAKVGRGRRGLAGVGGGWRGRALLDEKREQQPDHRGASE